VHQVGFPYTDVTIVILIWLWLYFIKRPV